MNHAPQAGSIFDRLIVFLATGFGSGRLPYVPGTWGSLVGVFLTWSVIDQSLIVKLLVAGAAFIVGIPLCTAAAKRLGGSSDPGSVVFDEIVGVFATLLWFPWSVTNALTGFVLFRLFDMLKPWPIRRFESLPGGLGIMADDLIAGLVAAAVMWARLKYFPST